MPKNALTPKQRRFVEEYLIDHNATRAAVRAGYSRRNAGKIGPRLVGKSRISREVEKAEKKISDKLGITAEWVKAQLHKHAAANLDDYVVRKDGKVTVDLSKCDREQMYAVSEYIVDHTGGTGDGERKLILRTRIKLPDRLRALELLGRCRDIQLFNDRMEISGKFSNLSDEELEAKYQELLAKAKG